MRTTISSRSTNRYHVNGESALVGHARYWGTHQADGTYDPAESAKIVGDAVASFSLCARGTLLNVERLLREAAFDTDRLMELEEIGRRDAAECRARALADDARRQMAYRDLIVATKTNERQTNGE